MQNQQALEGGYIAMVSNEQEPVFENRMEDVVSIEPKTRLKDEEDTQSLISDAPSVEHFNISVSSNATTNY